MKPKYLLLILIIFSSFGFIAFFLQSQSTNKFSSVNSVKLPTKVEALDVNSSLSASSPDGKKNLTMKIQTKNDGSTYSFYIENELLFTRTLANGKMSIPYNTWSIDDKHVFLKEEVTSGTNFYLEPEGINVSEKFKEKFPDYKLQDVTGWGGENLLVINANDGKDDISFWFDITSKSFIRLSNRFN